MVANGFGRKTGPGESDRCTAQDRTSSAGIRSRLGESNCLWPHSRRGARCEGARVAEGGLFVAIVPPRRSETLTICRYAMHHLVMRRNCRVLREVAEEGRIPQEYLRIQYSPGMQTCRHADCLRASKVDRTVFFFINTTKIPSAFSARSRCSKYPSCSRSWLQDQSVDRVTRISAGREEGRG